MRRLAKLAALAAIAVLVVAASASATSKSKHHAHHARQALGAWGYVSGRRIFYADSGSGFNPTQYLHGAGVRLPKTGSPAGIHPA